MNAHPHHKLTVLGKKGQQTVRSESTNASYDHVVSDIESRPSHLDNFIRRCSYTTCTRQLGQWLIDCITQLKVTATRVVAQVMNGREQAESSGVK